MFVSGKGVSRTGTDDNLICSTDFFATIAAIAGVEVNEIHDSRSFESLFTQSSTIRNYQYSEKDDGTDDEWTIRNANYKLRVNANGTEMMYDLMADPYEQNSLPINALSTEEQDAKTVLETELSLIRQ
jgi:arylsulfatase A-like enzyme